MTETRDTIAREPYRIGFNVDRRRWFVLDIRTGEHVAEFGTRERAIAYAAQMNEEATRWGL